MLRSSLWLVERYGISVTNDHGYVPLVVITFRSFPHSWFITGFVTRLTRWAPLVFSGVRVTRSLVLYVCFVDRCLSFCTFSFGHCVVCSSSIYGFWLSLWYLQTLLSFICMFCRSLFVLLYFFFWPLCCLFFFNIRILITSLRYLQTLLSDKLSYNVISSTYNQERDSNSQL